MIRKRAFNVTSFPLPSLFVLGVLALVMSGCRIQPEGSNADSSQANLSQTEILQSFSHLVHMNLDEEGIALRGYDPVSYFTEGEPIKGEEAHSFVWNDATWYFATAENRNLFSQNPEQYAPANGGYCTFGIVLRKKFDGDPQVWSVIKSRLYVFLNEEVQQKFLQDSTGNLQKVSANWPVIQFKSPEDL
ncbi:MAG: YHS domain-containing protein [Leptolyngbya sp. SIO3F4]|nr:YHS domain-containing protein [Leptolyngbya sp. SIO3F4]